MELVEWTLAVRGHGGSRAAEDLERTLPFIIELGTSLNGLLREACRRSTGDIPAADPEQ